MQPPTEKTVAAMIGAGVVSFVLSIPFFYYLRNTSPIAPDQATGRVYELNDHGHKFYVTITETVVFHTLVIGGWCLAACGGAIKLLNLSSNNRPPPF